MEKEFDLQEYMTKGVRQVVGDAVRATLKNPREAKFMAEFALASHKASKKRAKAEKEGEHIPPFLIASIASSCNLHCAGCYSRANHACCDEAEEVDPKPDKQLKRDDWAKIFRESDELGISFILLAGGEPLMRYDVIEEAAKYRDIMFPVFTNGTLLGETYLDMFDRHRNLIPIISIEGEDEATDARRGEGVYETVIRSMEELKKRELIFGVSVTVTTENIQAVFSQSFLKKLVDMGCKAVIYVEFVPVTEESTHLAPDVAEREFMAERVRDLRKNFEEMVFISFPGDEKGSGGCVAAGRGFFHINSFGGAEPCPFSPYSDINVRDTSVKEALHSRLFLTLQNDGSLKDEHRGGCTLYNAKEHVESLIFKEKPL